MNALFELQRGVLSGAYTGQYCIHYLMFSYLSDFFNNFNVLGVETIDRAAYVNLLKELRVAFEGEAKSSSQPKLILSAAVPASFEAIAAG